MADLETQAFQAIQLEAGTVSVEAVAKVLEMDSAIQHKEFEIGSRKDNSKKQVKKKKKSKSSCSSSSFSTVEVSSNSSSTDSDPDTEDLLSTSSKSHKGGPPKSGRLVPPFTAKGKPGRCGMPALRQ